LYCSIHINTRRRHRRARSTLDHFRTQLGSCDSEKFLHKKALSQGLDPGVRIIFIDRTDILLSYGHIYLPRDVPWLSILCVSSYIFPSISAGSVFRPSCTSKPYYREKRNPVLHRLPFWACPILSEALQTMLVGHFFFERPVPFSFFDRTRF
jgi:hypothetical protein